MFLIKLISEAVRENRNFEPPDRKMFQECVMNALRAAKQKHRRATDVKDDEVTKRQRMEQIADILYAKPSNNNVKQDETLSEPKSKKNNADISFSEDSVSSENDC